MVFEFVAEVLDRFAEILIGNFVVLLWCGMLGWTLLVTLPFHSFRVWLLILVVFVVTFQFSSHVSRRAILAKFRNNLNKTVSEYVTLYNLERRH